VIEKTRGLAHGFRNVTNDRIGDPARRRQLTPLPPTPTAGPTRTTLNWSRPHIGAVDQASTL